MCLKFYNVNRSCKLKCFYSRCGSLWSSGYFIYKVGKVSENTIRTYINEQNIKKVNF